MYVDCAAGMFRLTLARFPNFAIFASARGGGVGATPPPRVSKLRGLKLSEKKHLIALVQYSRLMLPFLILGEYLAQL